jgi:hypothetical protein
MITNKQIEKSSRSNVAKSVNGNLRKLQYIVRKVKTQNSLISNNGSIR